MSPNLDSQHNKDRVADLSYFKSHHFDVIRYLVQALSMRIVVDTMKQRLYVSKCCSMIAWSIHEFFKILKIDFDEVYEELRLNRSFVADVVNPREHLVLICNAFILWVFCYVIIVLLQGFITILTMKNASSVI